MPVQGVDLAEAVHGPGKAARPGTVAGEALMGSLLQEFAGFEIEHTFVGGGAVVADDRVAGGLAMGFGNAPEVLITGLVGRVEDQGDVHHDVDEQGVAADEGARGSPPVPRNALRGCVLPPGSCPSKACSPVNSYHGRNVFRKMKTRSWTLRSAFRCSRRRL